MKINKIYFVLFLIIGVISCQEKVSIKPAGELRLDYPSQHYSLMKPNCPWSFEMNNIAEILVKENCDVNIHYPQMKATLYLTYQAVGDSNLEALLRDAQKLTYDHSIKASSIPEQPFVNPDKNVYGMFYMINGNAATQAGFYVTDSINHFLNGALYFEAKPNFDSIYPAVMYLREDLRRLIETISWE